MLYFDRVVNGPVNHIVVMSIHLPRERVKNWNDKVDQNEITTVMFLSFQTDDQGLHCLQFPLHLLDALL